MILLSSEAGNLITKIQKEVFYFERVELRKNLAISFFVTTP